ncbi:putative sugar transporter [Halenospora varia]|nr:putative sugar transporter [Halenospora varia]
MELNDMRKIRVVTQPTLFDDDEQKLVDLETWDNMNKENWKIVIVLAISQFRHDYGSEFKGEFVVGAGVQLAFGAASFVGLMVGGALTAFVSKRWGRQVCMAGGFASTMLGVLFQFLSASPTPLTPSRASPALFLAGKLFTGIPLGIFITIAPPYCSELAPLSLRGAVTAAVNFSIVLGQCLAYVVMRQTQHLSGVNSYRVLFSVQWIFAGIGLIVLWWFPESPYLLVSQGKTEKARRNIGRLYGGGKGNFDQEGYFATILGTLEKEREEKRNEPGFKECFKGTNLRRTMIANSVFVVQAVCGISWIIGYMSYFLTLGGMSESRAFDVSVLLSFIMLVGNTFSWWLVESFGRRSTALYGSLTLFATLMLIGITSLFPKLLTAQVVFMGVWSFMYQATIGAVAWPIVSEVATSSLRGHTQSLVTMTTGLTGAIAGIVLPFAVNPDQGNLGGKIAFIYGGLLGLCCIGIWWWYPETKGLSFGEIDRLFESGGRPRDFGGARKTGKRGVK